MRTSHFKILVTVHPFVELHCPDVIVKLEVRCFGLEALTKLVMFMRPVCAVAITSLVEKSLDMYFVVRCSTVTLYMSILSPRPSLNPW